ncbi:OprO/OprP family phosphate-selective porin [Aeoliella sp. SH292]|uniref:OprO/OprP family phosphate-selective porin n=1 Tax=Aeoliella sp. SH292 TaxID=3454464 RepID=UPI003F976873
MLALAGGLLALLAPSCWAQSDSIRFDSLPAPAEAPAEILPDTAAEIAELRARIEALEKEKADAAEPKVEKPAEAKPLETESEWVDMSTDKWNVKLGGHVQMDWVHWADTNNDLIPEFDYFEFRRLRLMADGTGYGVYDFRLQMDIEPEGGDNVSTPVVDVKDAYFTINELPHHQKFRIGNFFVPFSLEQVTNDTNNIFMERSIPTQGIFSADREVGIALYGVTDDLDTTWTFGLFFDSISESLKEQIDDNTGQRISGRFTHLLYYDEPSNGRYLVHTGCGVLYTHDKDELVRFRARPQVHEGPFVIDTGQVPGTAYTTGNLEFAVVWGPVSVQSELFLSHVDQIGAPTATIGGAYAYLSYFLTGENRIYERFGQHGAQFGRNVPYTNVFWVPGGAGWGGWEAKVRYSNLTLNEMNSGNYNDVTAGFNWYWSDRVRMMFDWIHPITSASSTPYGESQSDLIAMRFDFNW